MEITGHVIPAEAKPRTTRGGTNNKTALRKLIKEYQEVVDLITKLNIPLSSAPVLSSRQWYRAEIIRLLQAEGYSEEAREKLAESLVRPEITCIERMGIYEESIYRRSAARQEV